MLNSKLVARIVAAPLLFTACSEDGGPDGNADLCEISGPTRLLAAPEGWQPDEYVTNANMRVLDDRLLYSFGERHFDAEYYLRGLCGGEPELVLDPDDGIFIGAITDGPVGRVLYGNDSDGVHYIVDRLDEPGIDTPRPVPGLPPLRSPGDALVWTEHLPHGPVWGRPGSLTDPPVHGVAGLGARTSELWTHNGAPEDAAVLLGTDVVRHYPFSGQIWVHNDDGRVRLLDQPTSTWTTLAEGARSAQGIPFGERFLVLVQDIGDDQAEPVRVVDPETGESRPVTINDFTQRSFGRDPEHGGAGTWSSLGNGDDTFIGLRGPDGPMIEGYMVSTLEPVELPEHLGVARSLGGPWIYLKLAGASAITIAAWDPFTDEMHEVYSGDEQTFMGREYFWSEDRLQYREELTKGVYRISALDVPTGAAEVLLPRVGDSYKELADGRVLTMFRDGGTADQIALFDPATQAFTTVVEGAREWHYAEDLELVVYSDYTGPEPGVWATPVPAR